MPGARSGISGTLCLTIKLSCSSVQSSQQFRSFALPRVPWGTGSSTLLGCVAGQDSPPWLPSQRVPLPGTCQEEEDGWKTSCTATQKPRAENSRGCEAEREIGELRPIPAEGINQLQGQAPRSEHSFHCSARQQTLLERGNPGACGKWGEFPKQPIIQNKNNSK